MSAFQTATVLYSLPSIFVITSSLVYYHLYNTNKTNLMSHKTEQSLCGNPGLHIQTVISMVNTTQVLFHVEINLFKDSHIWFHTYCPPKRFRCNQL